MRIGISRVAEIIILCSRISTGNVRKRKTAKHSNVYSPQPKRVVSAGTRRRSREPIDAPPLSGSAAPLSGVEGNGGESDIVSVRIPIPFLDRKRGTPHRGTAHINLIQQIHQLLQ